MGFARYFLQIPLSGRSQPGGRSNAESSMLDLEAVTKRGDD